MDSFLFATNTASFTKEVILMKTQFTFNTKTSAYAIKSSEANLMFIRYNESYFNDVLKIRGYIYLNSIYEAFGIKWDPDWENLSLRFTSGRPLKLGIRKVNEDGFDIDIL